MKIITRLIPAVVLAAALPLALAETKPDGPLPNFTFRGVALHPDKLKFCPTRELERCSLIKMEGRVQNPLGKYYLYYSPHKHVGIGLVYSDSIEGPWTEYEGNPVIEGTAIPDIRWIGATGNRYRGCEFYREGDSLYMYFSASDRPRVIAYATAQAGPAPDIAPAEPGNSSEQPGATDAPPPPP